MMQLTRGKSDEEKGATVEELHAKLAADLAAALDSKFAELSERLEGSLCSPKPVRLPASSSPSAEQAAASTLAAAQSDGGEEDAAALEAKISDLQKELATSRQQLQRLRASPATRAGSPMATSAASPAASPSVEIESLPAFNEKSMGNLHV